MVCCYITKPLLKRIEKKGGFAELVYAKVEGEKTTHQMYTRYT